MARLIVRERVLDDADAIAYYIAARNWGAGLRFYDAVAEALDLLKTFPGAGPRVEPPIAAYPDVHFLPIRRYRNYLVLYRRLPDGADILRIIHGARDVMRALKE